MLGIVRALGRQRDISNRNHLPQVGRENVQHTLEVVPSFEIRETKK